ncbi:tyrosine protein kinase [Pontibacter amylolyticus]|uniref:non-specific protein-tyrosine kinase n=2 Tax=Pontibacter amylolyticus TaxID=1424080 RepID=A0ABQ1W5I1_9BACT|nr:tyrosine protein kinase [Pontibacter amylolyticus]
MYESTASLIIKDENKGVDDPRMTESINMFTSKKIVENEIEVIQSRALMKKVVEDLGLYAVMYEEGNIKPISAYLSSPVSIKLKNPYKLPVNADQPSKISLGFNHKSNKVTLDKEVYPINKWVQTPYGEMQFLMNPNQQYKTSNILYVQLLHPQLVTDAILHNLSVSPASKLSTVVNLTIKDNVPQRGENILNQLIYIYHQTAVTDRNTLALNTLKFIEERIKVVEKELGLLESHVQKYKSTKGIVDLSEQGKVFLQNVGDNARKMEDITIQLAVLNKVEDYVISKNNTSSIVPATLGINDPVLSQLLQKLYDSEIQYQRLRKTTGENNPLVVSIYDEIEKIRPSILENIQSQRENLLATRSNLLNTRSKYNTALQIIPENERELLDITRQLEIKNSVYTFLLQKREETALSFAPITTDSRVIDVAESSLWPVSPKPNLVYIIAFGMAILTGVVLITGKELLSGKILYRSEVENFIKAPIVAELSNISKRKSKVFEKPDAYVIEQFRHMRTTLGLYGRTFSKKKILVTSSIPGEGKSYVSSNLAYSLALSGKRVALLDMDLRNPNATTLFDSLNEEGITDYLNSEIEIAKIIKETDLANLILIPAGTNIGDNSELLLNGRLETLFDLLEAEFDYIILDSPPASLVTDAYLLAEFCDITLFIVRHAYTPKSIVQRLELVTRTQPIKNLAIVFNGVKVRGFFKESYGYGYGYSVEGKYKNNYAHRRS